jgi:hypothetical protein
MLLSLISLPSFAGDNTISITTKGSSMTVLFSVVQAQVALYRAAHMLLIPVQMQTGISLSMAIAILLECILCGQII